MLFTATVTAKANTAMARNSATSVRSEARAIDETMPSSADRATADSNSGGTTVSTAAPATAAPLTSTQGAAPTQSLC